MSIAANTKPSGLNFLFTVLLLSSFVCLPIVSIFSQNCNNSTLAASASNDSPLCIGQNINLAGNSNTGNVKFAWSGPNDFASNEQYITLPNVTPMSQGTYTVTVTNVLGCTATASTSVVVNGQGTAGCNCLQQGCSDYVNLIFNGTISQTADLSGLEGDMWRINGVAAGIDAEMKIVGQKNAYQVQNIDNNGAGVIVPNNWSPELGFNLVPNDSSYVDWEIRLYTSGTNTPASLSKSSRVTSMDVDGNLDYREFHRHLNTNGYVANNPTELTFGANGPYTIVGGSMLEHTGISDDPEVKATFYYPQTTTVYKIRLGVLAASTASGQVSGRQYAISFNPCQDYTNPVANPVFPDISGVNNVCPSNLTQTYTLNTNFANITWSVVGGTIVSGQGTMSVVVNWTNNGIQNLTASTTDANGCVFADQKFVKVSHILTVDISNNLSVCTAIKADFTSTIIGGSASLTYQWQSSPNGATSWLNIATANTPKYTAITTSVGTIWYRLCVTDNNYPCAPTYSPAKTVTVNPDPANVTVGGGNITCTNKTVQLLGNTSTTGVSYAWAGPNGMTATSKNLTVNGFGEYILTVKSTATGCSASAATFVQVDTMPITVNATGGALDCLNPSIKLFAYANRIGLNYTWSSTNGFNSTQINPTVTVSGQYKVVATNPANGCSATTQTIVTQSLNAPNVTAKGDFLNCGHTLANLSANSSTSGVIFEWTGPGGFVFKGKSPKVGQAGTYSVVTFDPSNGCRSAVGTAIVIIP
jgi:PKD-like domain